MLKHKEYGFTMTELIITIAVFGLTVPALASLIISLNNMNDRARDMAIINGMVENKIESLRSISYVGLQDGTVDFTDELPTTISRPHSATYTITSPSNGLKTVDVNIEYKDQGSERSLQYRTHIGELGVGQY